MGLKISPASSVSLRPEAKLTASMSDVDVGAVLLVTGGKGALFPTYGGGDYSYLTLYDAAGNVEVIKVTARSTDTFTIDASGRGLDNTNAKAWSIGDGVRLGLPPVALVELASNPTWSGTAGGTADALALTTTFPAAAYTNGMPIEFIVASNNTGAVTVNVNTLGVKNLVWNNAVGLVSGDLLAGMVIRAVYDGTSFVIDSGPYEVTAFAKTLLNDANVAAAQTTLGISSFGSQLVDDATPAAARATLGINEPGLKLLEVANVTGEAEIVFDLSPHTNHNAFRFVFQGISTSANGDSFRLHYSATGGAPWSTSGTFIRNSCDHAAPTVLDGTGSGGAGPVDLALNVQSAFTTLNGTMDFLQAFSNRNGAKWSLGHITGTTGEFTQTWGYASSTLVVNALRFIMSNGTISGRIHMYGVLDGF